MNRAPAWQRTLVTGICAYEIVALWMSGIPTITNIVHRYPRVKPALLLILDDHFNPGGL